MNVLNAFMVCVLLSCGSASAQVAYFKADLYLYDVQGYLDVTNVPETNGSMIVSAEWSEKDRKYYVSCVVLWRESKTPVRGLSRDSYEYPFVRYQDKIIDLEELNIKLLPQCAMEFLRILRSPGLSPTL